MLRKAGQSHKVLGTKCEFAQASRSSRGQNYEHHFTDAETSSERFMVYLRPHSRVGRGLLMPGDFPWVAPPLRVFFSTEVF